MTMTITITTVLALFLTKSILYLDVTKIREE